MDILELDIETYSEVELKRANVYAYSEHPSFLVLMCGWSLNGSPIEVWEGEPDIHSIPGLFDPDVKKVAHNAPFERICFSRMKGLPVGQYLPAEEYFDTMAIAAEYGLPRSLAGMAKYLKAEAKDEAGTRLKNLFTVPHGGKRVLPHMKPKEWEEFKAYCGQDVSTMQDVRRVLREKGITGWPSAFERDLWYLDQKINDRGMKIDLDLASAAVKMAHENTRLAAEEVIALTGVENPNSGPQMLAWFNDNGLSIGNLQARTVKDALNRSDISDTVQRVLELRQELALVAHRKFEAAERSVSMDGRLRGQFMFYAAHTARWSSRGVQVHNMPRLAFEDKDKDGNKYYSVAKETDAIIALLRGDTVSPEDLKRLVRPLFLGPLASSDFSAIEARVLAWLSGELWVLQAFIEGRDLYVENAERMGAGMDRGDGKIAVLAGGYQGSVGAYRKFGYGGRRCGRDLFTAPKDETDTQRADRLRRMEVSHADELLRDPDHKDDAEILVLVNLWRDANDMTRQFWYDMQRKFWSGGKVGAGHIHVQVKGTSRFIHLPSGRIMAYHGVCKQRTKRVVDDETGDVIEEGGRTQIAYDHIQGYKQKTYGGKLTENVTQAVARDLLADALLRLDAAGYDIIGHVHDEALIDFTNIVEGEVVAKAEIQEIMRTGPSWAEGLPMDASIDVLLRYRKD